MTGNQALVVRGVSNGRLCRGVHGSRTGSCTSFIGLTNLFSIKVIHLRRISLQRHYVWPACESRGTQLPTSHRRLCSQHHDMFRPPLSECRFRPGPGTRLSEEGCIDAATQITRLRTLKICGLTCLLDMPDRKEA